MPPTNADSDYLGLYLSGITTQQSTGTVLNLHTAQQSQAQAQAQIALAQAQYNQAQYNQALINTAQTNAAMVQNATIPVGWAAPVSTAIGASGLYPSHGVYPPGSYPPGTTVTTTGGNPTWYPTRLEQPAITPTTMFFDILNRIEDGTWYGLPGTWMRKGSADNDINPLMPGIAKRSWMPYSYDDAASKITHRRDFDPKQVSLRATVSFLMANGYRPAPIIEYMEEYGIGFVEN